MQRTSRCLGGKVKPGDKFLHPITLEIITNTSKMDVCASDLRLKDGNNYSDISRHISSNNSNILSANEIQKYMALPYVRFSESTILSMYNINTIDSLINWVKAMIKKDKLFSYVNRIINIWIYVNHETIVNNNNILIILYKTINKHYYKIEIDDEDLREYIHEWFKTKNSNDFIFNLGLDILNKFKK